MAMLNVMHTAECEDDDREETKYFCPVCGEEINPDEWIYTNADQEIVGCELCVSHNFVEDFFN